MKPVVLIILDGWGHSEKKTGNAINEAHTPCYDALLTTSSHTLISTSAEAVGLPEGQMGNSEVGHLNIGAGRIVCQDFVKISHAIQTGEFYKNQTIQNFFQKIKTNALHLMGLVSDGGVHSHESHLYAILTAAKSFGIKNVYVHAFLDGRDTPPKSALTYIKRLEAFITKEDGIKIATIMGRYYAMDRDRRWDRIHKAYDAIVQASGPGAKNAVSVIESSYQKQITDEFIIPTVIVDHCNQPIAKLNNGDGVFYFNFRADRARQLTESLTQENFTDFKREAVKKIQFISMTKYAEHYNLPMAFLPDNLDMILGEVLEKNNIPNLRIAETEKYAHVTFFFNGGKEKVFRGEERVLIPSPSVATYDLKPEMSSYEITDRIVHEIKNKHFPLIIVNFANVDMVGHSGKVAPTIKAIEAVDACLCRIINELKPLNGKALITSDHGNAEMMIDENGEPHTAHTTNPVPFILFDPEWKGNLKTNGSLQDIAPTILDIMNIPKPSQMTGNSLRIIPR